MCYCDKPTRNENESWRAPPAQDGETVLFDEPGRCSPQVNGSGSIDYHSHHYRVVRDEGAFALLVRHGGGDERIELGYSNTRIADVLGLLDSDARYLMMHALYTLHSAAKRQAHDAEKHRWSKAAVEKRIKTRRKDGAILVWIEEA